MAGQEVFHNINGSIYTPDADHHNQWIMENGVKVDRYYHPGVGMTLWDLTGKPTFGEVVDTVVNTPDWFPVPQLKFGSLIPKIGNFFKGIGNAFTTTKSAANTVGKELGGTVSELNNGWKIEIPNGNKPVVVRIMNEGSGGRSQPYFRVSIDGKGSFTLDGKLSNDRGLTHINMSDEYLKQITDIVNSYIGK